MPVVHEPWIVALSILVAIQGSYVALGLTLRLATATGTMRRLVLAAAAFTFALSIWAMHFVGMLAARVPFPVDYLVLPTLLSFLAAVLVAGAAVLVASHAPRAVWAVPVAAAIMGLGIATMHYIGMLALHASAEMHHEPWHVLASFAIAVVASALGLRFAFAPRRVVPKVVAAVLFGLAISGMHYVAMAGLTVAPAAGHASEYAGAALSPDLLAVVVAVVAFAVSAVFLLTLVPDASPAVAPEIEPPPSSEVPPVRRLTAEEVQPTTRPQVIPIEREGTTHYLPVEQVVLVQADTHYTTVSDGVGRWFCPLPIGAVEQRLDQARFLRVHRSYIVAAARIASLRRSGDGGVATLDTADAASVPVSRARFAAVKARLESRQPVVVKRE